MKFDIENYCLLIQILQAVQRLLPMKVKKKKIPKVNGLSACYGANSNEKRKKKNKLPKKLTWPKISISFCWHNVKQLRFLILPVPLNHDFVLDCATSFSILSVQYTNRPFLLLLKARLQGKATIVRQNPSNFFYEIQMWYKHFLSRGRVNVNIFRMPFCFLNLNALFYIHFNTLFCQTNKSKSKTKIEVNSQSKNE